MSRIGFIGRVVVLVGVLIIPLAARTDEVPRLAVYFPDYRLEKNRVPDFTGVTHLILFAGSPRPDGSVDFSRVSPDLIGMGKRARAASGLKLQVCVGGWVRSRSFADAVSSPESRSRFVDSLVRFCHENQMDGVDLDWEFPRSETEGNHFTAFLAQLSGEFRPRDLILSVTLSSRTPLPSA